MKITRALLIPVLLATVNVAVASTLVKVRITVDPSKDEFIRQGYVYLREAKTGKRLGRLYCDNVDRTTLHCQETFDLPAGFYDLEGATEAVHKPSGKFAYANYDVTVLSQKGKPAQQAGTARIGGKYTGSREWRRFDNIYTFSLRQ